MSDQSPRATEPPVGVVSSAELGELPEPEYYAAADSDIRPRLMHRRAEVEMHLKHLEKDGGRPVPWEGNVWGLYSERRVRLIVAAAVAAERERCAKLCDSLGGDTAPRDPDESMLCANSLAEAIRAGKRA
jgi:hypothetical protein